MKTARQIVDDLAYCLEETHADEMNNAHYGDSPDGCQYCQAIADAKQYLDQPDAQSEPTPDPAPDTDLMDLCRRASDYIQGMADEAEKYDDPEDAADVIALAIALRKATTDSPA